MLELINGRRCPTPPTQGFVLGQYALLWAQQNADKVDRLLVLNTPLAKSSKLRPELAAYKAPLPFMRPGSVSHGLTVAQGSETRWLPVDNGGSACCPLYDPCHSHGFSQNKLQHSDASLFCMQKPFDGINYNAAGSPYSMNYSDAMIYNRPYADSPVASQIIAKTMDKVGSPPGSAWVIVSDAPSLM